MDPQPGGAQTARDTRRKICVDHRPSQRPDGDFSQIFSLKKVSRLYCVFCMPSVSCAQCVDQKLPCNASFLRAVYV